MHSEHDNTESSALTLNEEETTDEVLSEAQSLDASQDDDELTELPQDDEDEEDEEDIILNAAMLELGSVSDDDEASVEFTDGSSNEASTEVKAEDLTESDETDKTDAASKDDAKRPKRKKKSRETVPAAPLRDETVNALEALLFASGDAMTLNEIKRVFARYWKRMEPTALEAELGSLREAMKALTERWNGDEVAASSRGFRLVHVAEGYAFRSSPEFSDIVRAMREQRPMRLSKPAMEVLSIVAYRQPVTKGEVDFIRGVDCGGTLRILLDRGMIKVVGKREEPGRPLLYGTTREFLNFFNLPTLRALPSLREYRELNADSSDKLKEFDLEHGISEIAEEAAQLQLEEEPAVAELSDALEGLDKTEEQARSSLAEHGIALDDEE